MCYINWYYIVENNAGHLKLASSYLGEKEQCQFCKKKTTIFDSYNGVLVSYT